MNSTETGENPPAPNNGQKPSSKRKIPSERVRIARPPMTDNGEHGLPLVTHEGTLKIGEETRLPCYVLEDGRRLLSGKAVYHGLGFSSHSNKGATRLINMPTLKGFLSEKLVTALQSPVEISTGVNRFTGSCYEAWVLPELCHAILDAADANHLRPSQAAIVKQAKLLVRGLSIIGITALVDEATGYQNERAHDALEEILKQFISAELLKWAKTFPDEFYSEMFRLRGIRQSEVAAHRPGYIGKLTNDVVYERLAPGVLDELKRITPKDDKGRRKHKYFMRLTEDVGHPKLREHLSNVIVLMRASPNWTSFYRLLQRSLPKYTDQLALPITVAYTSD